MPNLKSPSITDRQSTQLYSVVQELGVWFITAVCGFLAYNVWQMSVAVERLAVNITYMSRMDDEYNERVVAIGQRLSSVEADIGSRSNIRWNWPDMERWARETEQMNENWRSAPLRSP